MYQEVIWGLGEKTVRAGHLCWDRIWQSLSCSASLDRVIISRIGGLLLRTSIGARNSQEFHEQRNFRAGTTVSRVRIGTKHVYRKFWFEYSPVPRSNNHRANSEIRSPRCSSFSFSLSLYFFGNALTPPLTQLIWTNLSKSKYQYYGQF